MGVVVWVTVGEPGGGGVDTYLVVCLGDGARFGKAFAAGDCYVCAVALVVVFPTN